MTTQDSLTIELAQCQYNFLISSLIIDSLWED